MWPGEAEAGEQRSTQGGCGKSNAYQGQTGDFSKDTGGSDDAMSGLGMARPSNLSLINTFPL